jgi:hypothetical protein
MCAVGGQGRRGEAQKLYEQGKKVLHRVFWTEEDKQKHVISLESSYKNLTDRGVVVTG